MHVFITSDSNWDAKIDHATRSLNAVRQFYGRDYGPGLASLIIVLMCRDPALNFKKRIRFTKATKTLGIDIMLPLDQFIRVPHQQRRTLIAESMLSETRRIIRKYTLRDFDSVNFLTDFENYVTDCLLGPDAAKFDHLCLP